MLAGKTRTQQQQMIEDMLLGFMMALMIFVLTGITIHFIKMNRERKQLLAAFNDYYKTDFNNLQEVRGYLASI